MPTFGELRQELQETIKAEGIEVPSNERLNRLLNRAKDQLVGHLEGLFENAFNNTISYTIALNATSFTLPNGRTTDTDLGLTTSTGATVPAFRRLLRLQRTDLGYDIPVSIISQVDRPSYEVDDGMSGEAPIVYRLGNAFQFTATNGASKAMTIQMDYAFTEADIDGTSDSAVYTTIPAEWTDLLIFRAASDHFPAAHPARGKYLALWEARNRELQDFGQHQLKHRAMRVRHENDWFHDSEDLRFF